MFGVVVIGCDVYASNTRRAVDVEMPLALEVGIFVSICGAPEVEAEDALAMLMWRV